MTDWGFMNGFGGGGESCLSTYNSKHPKFNDNYALFHVDRKTCSLSGIIEKQL